MQFMKLFTISIPYPRVIKGGNEQKKILVFLILLQQILFFSGIDTASGQSTGWLNPSTNPYNNDVSNPTNAYTSDNQRATFNTTSDVADFGGFNISLPANAIITGIEVRIEGYNDGYGWDETPRQLEAVSLTWNNGSTFTAAVPLILL